MMRRVVWFGGGMAAGAGGAVWAQRKVRAQIERARPSHLAVVASDAARAAGGVVREAVQEGRSAARDREAQLRNRYEPSRGPRQAPR